MGIRQMKEILHGYMVYDDEDNELLGVADITLPSFDSVTTTIKGAGIGGEIEVPVVGHFKSMTVGIKFRMAEDAALRLLAPKIHTLTFRAALQVYDSARTNLETQQFRVVVEGRTKKTELGKFSTGETMDSSVDIEVIKIDIFSNDIPIVEFDKIRNVFIVDGEDYLADINEALGRNPI